MLWYRPTVRRFRLLGVTCRLFDGLPEMTGSERVSDLARRMSAWDAVVAARPGWLSRLDDQGGVCRGRRCDNDGGHQARGRPHDVDVEGVRSSGGLDRTGAALSRRGAFKRANAILLAASCCSQGSLPAAVAAVTSNDDHRDTLGSSLSPGCSLSAKCRSPRTPTTARSRAPSASVGRDAHVGW